MNGYFKKTAIATLCGAIIGMSGCGGSDSGSAIPSTINITPSLGQISDATVTVYQADGITVLGSGELGSDGVVSIDFSGYSGPVVIEVAGDADAQYFDEASATLVSFPAGQKLRAMAPSASGSFAVTPLTELAYQGVVNQSLLPLTAAEVNASNETVRAALIPEITDLLTPPALFNAATTSGSLAEDAAGKYALKLAALAKLGNGQASPALAVLQALIADLADGEIDGLDGSGTSINPPYTSFASEFSAAISAIADAYGSEALKSAAAGFAAPQTSIDFVHAGGGTTDGGGSGGGFSLSCNTALFAEGAPIATPTGMDFIAFAGIFMGEEGTYNMDSSFTQTGLAALTLSVAGELSYKGHTHAVTSACVETLTGGNKQLVLHTELGHFDFSADKTTVTGISPADGMTAFRVVGNGSSGGDGSSGGGTSGDSVSSGLAIPGGGRLSSAASVTFMPLLNQPGKIITFKEGEVTLTLYDYQATHTLGVAVGDTGLSIGVTPYNACALDAAGVSDYTPSCASVGVAFDRSAGRISFTNTPMHAIVFSCPGDCTINGALSFTPY